MRGHVLSLAVCPHNGCGFSGRKALGENNRCTFDYGLPFEFLKKRIDIAAECVIYLARRTECEILPGNGVVCDVNCGIGIAERQFRLFAIGPPRVFRWRHPC